LARADWPCPALPLGKGGIAPSRPLGLPRLALPFLGHGGAGRAFGSTGFGLGLGGPFLPGRGRWRFAPNFRPHSGAPACPLAPLSFAYRLSLPSPRRDWAFLGLGLPACLGLPLGGFGLPSALAFGLGFPMAWLRKGLSFPSSSLRDSGLRPSRFFPSSFPSGLGFGGGAAGLGGALALCLSPRFRRMAWAFLPPWLERDSGLRARFLPPFRSPWLGFGRAFGLPFPWASGAGRPMAQLGALGAGLPFGALRAMGGPLFASIPPPARLDGFARRLGFGLARFAFASAGGLKKQRIS
jgi:hypothetical protein